jgi:hypothetical protein
MQQVDEIAEYRRIANHIRTTLLDCDMLCDTCTKADKANCVADMKTALYEVLGMVEQLYTLVGIVAGMVTSPQLVIDQEKPPEKKESGMFS